MELSLEELKLMDSALFKILFKMDQEGIKIRDERRVAVVRMAIRVRKEIKKLEK